MVLETPGTLMIYKPYFENLFSQSHAKMLSYFSAKSLEIIFYTEERIFLDKVIKSSLKRQAVIKLALQIYSWRS